MATYIINSPAGQLERKSLKEVKKTIATIKEAYGVDCTFAKVVKAFYRGTEITVIEDRQNNWTLVNNVDGSKMFYFAVTTEIEYR